MNKGPVEKKYRSKVRRFWDKMSKGEKVNLSNSFIKNTHAADLAEIIANITSEEKQIDTFISFLPEDQRGQVFSEFPDELQQDVLDNIDNEKLGELFESLPPDEAVDLLSKLEQSRQDALLRTLPSSQRRKFAGLLRYGHECAGGIMTPILISVYGDQTTGDVIEAMRRNKEEQETFIHIFIVDKKEKLIGSVTLQNLIVSEPDVKLQEIMIPYPIAVSVHDDQEVVAHTVSKYNLLTVPVIDDMERLVGRITFDDIMEVMQEEAEEDVYRMAGMDADEIHVNSALMIARMRLPWLLTCLAGSFVSGLVISVYRDILAQVILILLIFLPAICAMGGNSGLQASTVTIRNLAFGGVFYKNIRKIVRRELMAGVTIGIVAGTVVGCVATLWLKNGFYGFIIGCSMLLTISISTCTGFFIPIFFSRVGIDPAVASGPLITTLNDATSTLVYLSMATGLIHLLSMV